MKTFVVVTHLHHGQQPNALCVQPHETLVAVPVHLLHKTNRGMVQCTRVYESDMRARLHMGLRTCSLLLFVGVDEPRCLAISKHTVAARPLLITKVPPDSTSR
jgi:hypothetical protein